MIRLAPVAWLLAVALPVAAQPNPAKSLEGKYTLKSLSVAGKTLDRPEKDRETLVIRDGNLIAVSADGKKEDPIAIKFDGDKVDFTEPGRKGGPHMVGVYKLDGQTLTFCVVESDKPADRPKDVTATGDGIITMVLARVPAEKSAEPKKK